MKKRNTIPTILGVVVLLLGSIAGVYLLNNTQVFKIGADASVSVKNIRTANISDNSVTITWTTDKPTEGYIVWGKSQSNLDKTENEDVSGQKYYNHSVNLTGLKELSNYYYKINSEGSLFDNSGIPWQFTTGPNIAPNKNSVLISGVVISASGQPENKALVYADISGYLLSTETSETGNFVFQIASARTNDLQSYTAIDPAQTLIQLSVQANPDGVSSAQIFPQSANPMPSIVVGQTYDFRNQTANTNSQNPSANLNLPQDLPQQSKFNVEIPDQTPNPTSVILESLNEGETVTTNQPQFFGKGPSGTTLTITVHSENPISGNVQIPKTGSWSFATPTNLEPGNHTITVSWVDISGITRFLTRDFVVSAGDVPAFTASESGSTPTPIATGKPSPSTSPAPTATATAMPVPVTGDFTPTLLLFIMSLGVLVFSLVIWKVAEN